jgi:hypothetical protein
MLKEMLENQAVLSGNCYDCHKHVTQKKNPKKFNAERFV